MTGRDADPSREDGAANGSGPGVDGADDGAEPASDRTRAPGPTDAGSVDAPESAAAPSARARATIRSRVADPETVAAALAPDDTDEMTTRVEDGRVVARIERPTAGGLRTTADDYVTNLQVAVQLTTDTDQP